MSNLPVALDPARYAQQPPGDDGLPEGFIDFGPENDVRHACFILQCREEPPEAVPGRWRVIYKTGHGDSSDRLLQTLMGQTIR